MSVNTMFGHLALQFTTHPENLATEALAFVLRNSAAASGAFSVFLRSAGIEARTIFNLRRNRSGSNTRYLT